MDTDPNPIDSYVVWLDSLWAARLRRERDPKPELSVGILLWPGFPMMSLTGVIEPLRHSGDFADHSRPLYCRWSIMGAGATASCGLHIQADTAYLNPTDFNYIVVIGGLLPQLAKAPQRHRDYLRVAAAAGVPLIGVCTGVFVLAQEGLLTGVKASVHPFHEQDFRLSFPRLALSTRDDYLDLGHRITVPGGISILSLMTSLIQRHCGPDRAAKAVHQLSLTQRKSVSAFERNRSDEYPRVADPRMQRAVVLIESCKGTHISTGQVARAVGLSERQLNRLSTDNFGMSVKAFIVETRLRYARFLVENSSMPITGIAFEAGFADCAHFSTSFRKRFGRTPRGMRQGGTSADASLSRH